MATIRFTSEFTLANAQRPRTYRVGDVLDCNEATARRYIRRGVAVRLDDPPAPSSGQAEGEDGLFADGSGPDDSKEAGQGGDEAGAKPKPKSGGGKKRQRIE